MAPNEVHYGKVSRRLLVYGLKCQAVPVQGKVPLAHLLKLKIDTSYHGGHSNDSDESGGALKLSVY